MNDAALQWLTERASPTGTLACALRTPDGQFISHSADPACAATTIENILGNFDALAAAAGDTTAQWSTWAFEQGQLRLMERADGWRLALAVRSEPASPPALDALSQEFLTVAFGG